MASAKKLSYEINAFRCLTFYLDDSNLRLTQETDIPNTFLLGGILADPQAEKELIAVMNSVKNQYGKAGYPIKWNFKDLKKKYEERNALDIYYKLLQSSQEWRKDILSKSLDIDYSIIITGIVSYSANSAIIKSSTNKLTRFGFINLLERIYRIAKSKQVQKVEIVSDWPSGSLHHPFTEEYRFLYEQGRSSVGSCFLPAPLKSVGFSDALRFSLSQDSQLLQLTDLIIGATNEFLGSVINGKSPQLGYESTKLLLPKFYGYPNDLLSKGLKLQTSDTIAIQKLKDALCLIKQAA